ncbi:hypothetical protein [Wolbachia endosymbiont of Ctenocephalides felis wCfeT]|uniref:hypothetical protein n=1 Tax=Wolbachia endosymbiont of Ctenocephalides felis wCfeT TaxID=2732593 RepID=UPI001446568D|nr:hypothetical protein [Wolbachia endosymbiont of Ctenocephalides felis wCfeT]
MSYNEEDLIRVKRGSCVCKECQKDEEEGIELQPQPTPPPAQVLEGRPHSIVLEEIHWILSGPSDLGSRISAPRLPHVTRDILHSATFSRAECEFITDLTNSIPEPSHDRGVRLGYMTYDSLHSSQIILDLLDDLVTRIIDASMKSMESLTEGNLAEYRINAEQLQREFNDLNRVQQRAIDRYDANLNGALARTFERIDRGGYYTDEMTPTEFKAQVAQDTNEHKNPLQGNNELIQFLYLVYRAVRTLEVEYTIKEFLHNIMPTLVSGLNSDTANMVRGWFLKDLISTLYPEAPCSDLLIRYQTYMKFIYSNLLKSLDKLKYKEGKVVREETIDGGDSYDDYHYDFDISKTPRGDFLSYFRNTIQEHHDRLEGKIARSKEESDAMCAQLEEHDEQVISTEELRGEINAILEGYRSILNLIEKEEKLGSDSPKYKEAIRERNALQQIVRDLDSKDEVRIQQAISDAQKNETVRKMLAEKNFILTTPNCKPFKNPHGKKDDHDDSNGGPGGNDPKPGPSGEARLIESTKSIVDVPKASSSFVEAVDDLTDLVKELKTLIAEAAEAERVYLVASRSCRESQEISLKGFWKWAKGSL